MNFNQFLTNLIPWFFSQGLKIIGILVVAWITNRIVKVFIYRIIKNIIRKSAAKIKDGQVREQRVKTIVKVLRSIFSFVIWIIAILTILPELNVNIAPLLASLGIAGLALGMGARNLIQDYISGIFILIENHYKEGDIVSIMGIKGRVMELNLRRTVIRDEEGVFHIIPNGQINRVSNHSRK